MEKEATTKSEPSTSLPLKIRFLLSIFSFIDNSTTRRDGTINRRLLKFIDLKSPPNSKPINGVKTHDVTVDPSRNLWFRVFTPTAQLSTDHLPVIIYFHGGGFVKYGPDTKPFDTLCRGFAGRIPAVIVSVNYRLAPEFRYPSQYEDGFDVVRFLDDDNNWIHLRQMAGLSRCFVAGDSAGGNVAHHVAKRASESQFRHLKVIGLVALQPFFGGEERTDSEKRAVESSIYGLSLNRTDFFWNSFKPLSSGEEWNRDHEAINVSGPSAVDISGLDFPATLVVVGGLDILQDWQRKYYQWLKGSGKEAYIVEYPNMFHGFYAFPELPESSQLILDVADFVHKQIQKFSSDVSG